MSPDRRCAGISVVVPVYNGDETLPELVERLEPVLREQAEEFEAILVDDDSHSDAWRVVAELAEQRPWVRGIRLMRNVGQHNALLCGVRAARYPIVVTMDDDLQNPPEEIPVLLAKLQEGFDMVYGAPVREQHGLWRDLASQITKLALAKAMGAETASSVSAFRAFRTRLRDAFAGYDSPFVSIDVLLTWGTRRFAVVRVPHQPRKSGVSNYTMRRLVLHALNMMTGFSSLPLQLASMIGFASTFFGILTLAYVLGRFLIQGSVVPGFAFLASTIAIFAGAQLFSLGIIGEYLARIHFRTLGQPSYTVGQTVGFPRPTPESGPGSPLE